MANAFNGGRRRAIRVGRKPIRSTSPATWNRAATCIGVTVLFYGAGDGTWPLGKPGFLFWLEIEQDDGRVERIVSDGSGRRWFAGPGDRGGPNGGICGRSKRSSMAACTPTGGLNPASSRTANGCPLCPWPGRRISPPSPPTTTSTCSTWAAARRIANSARAAFRCCGSRSCPRPN